MSHARWSRLLRPLDPLRSIKIKLGVVIVGSVIASLWAVVFGWTTGIRPRWLVASTGITALVVIQLLAHGMTRPLRDMARAARAMAAGDYSVRVETNAVDEVGELAAAFNVMRDHLAAVDADRRALIANVSHELRTPLAGARARLENIVDGVDPASPESLSAVLRSIERMSGLVDDLLDDSRLEAGVAPMHRERIAVGDVIDAVAEEFQMMPSPPRLDVVVDHDLEVNADAARLHQVVANLVANAARHAGGAVEIRARRRADVVVIEVADCGPGLDAASRSLAFDRFQRVGSAIEGSGLGLPIARRIVELHGGSIRLDANQPSGCRAVVELPAVPIKEVP